MYGWWSMKILFVILAVILVCPGSRAHAFFYRLTNPDDSQDVSQAQIVQKGKDRHSRVQLGGSYTELGLKPSGKASYNGWLPGAQGAYEYWANGHLYLGVTANWRQGTVTHHSAHRWVAYVDNQERVGIVLGKKKNGTSWTFFTGLGYRYLFQKFRESKLSWRYHYHELYCPVGVAMEYTIGPWFIVDVNFTWMPEVYPSVHINSTKRSHYPLAREIRNFSLEVPFDFPLMLNQRLHLLVIPFGEYWKDAGRKAKRKSGETFKIRQTNYNYWGVDLNLAWCF